MEPKDTQYAAYPRVKNLPTRAEFEHLCQAYDAAWTIALLSFAGILAFLFLFVVAVRFSEAGMVWLLCLVIWGLIEVVLCYLAINLSKRLDDVLGMNVTALRVLTVIGMLVPLVGGIAGRVFRYVIETKVTPYKETRLVLGLRRIMRKKTLAWLEEMDRERESGDMSKPPVM